MGYHDDWQQRVATTGSHTKWQQWNTTAGAHNGRPYWAATAGSNNESQERDALRRGGGTNETHWSTGAQENIDTRVTSYEQNSAESDLPLYAT